MVEQPGLVRVQATELIAAALRGEPAVAVPPTLRDDLAQAALAHGVAPLLLRTAAVLAWPADLVQSLRRVAAAEAALALIRTRELRRLLDAFQSSDVYPLLIKGAHLSRTCYPAPECRPHSDVDILVAPDDRRRALGALRDAGYALLPHVTGEVAFTQVPVVRTEENGARHQVDLHWRICGPRVFAERLLWAELHADCVPMPSLHPHAAAPSNVHALMLACIHRTAHHANNDRLIWLYDIRLLAGRMCGAEWEALVASAVEKGIAPVVLNGLAAAATRVGAAVPVHVRQMLAKAGSDSAATAFLAATHSPIKVLVSDWRSLRGSGLRARFLREHLLPSASYMKQKYGTDSTARLPFLYVHRLLSGARRWLLIP